VALSYRKMIPPLLAAEHPCVAPDHIGFERSDKLAEDGRHVIDRHIARPRRLIERLGLTDITLAVQDWGGPIGLINAAEMPARVSRLAILTAWLHHARCAYGAGSRGWRDAATIPIGWRGRAMTCRAGRSCAAPPSAPSPIRLR
jgi:pimeloyl-ACP methyl ester carboxylesterase